MRLGRVFSFVACCAVIGAFAAACFGGGSSDGQAPDVNRIPTATLPAKLPEAKVLSNSAVSAGGASTYAVKDGDTLAGIAARFGVALDDLRDANPGIDASTLSIGQVIHLPQSPDGQQAVAPTATKPSPTEVPSTEVASTATPPLDATPAPPAADTPAPPSDTPTATSVGQTYVVQEGDYPAKIAEKFGISVEDFLAANPGINPTDMHIGDVVIIPPKRD